MSFLKRVLLIVGLSVSFTTILMVIYWEPERAVKQVPVEEATAPKAPTVAPVVYRSAEVRTGTTPLRDAADLDALPAEVRGAFAGCLVPASEPLSVIAGEFKQAGQVDLAVLCVRGAVAGVYVLWGGRPDVPELAAEFDFIDGAFIQTAHAADIGERVKAELPIEPGMPLRIRHDGIQLSGGCCATTYYLHRGRWRSYVSAD